MKYIFFLFLTISLFADQYVVKFKEYNNDLISKYMADFKLQKYFTNSEDELISLKERGEKLSGDNLADLRTYFNVELSKDNFLKLSNDKNIEIIYEQPIITKLPVSDISPTTSSYMSNQGYLNGFANHKGLGSVSGWAHKGGAGTNITVVDIEYEWTVGHEDLDFTFLAGTGTAKPTYGPDHGNAVLGEIKGAKNSYGITGMAYNVNMKVASCNTNEHGFSVGSAIIRVTPKLKDGDVILLEQQTERTEDSSNSTDEFIPVEYYQAEFDAIKTATSNKIIVVEAGGNGGQNLDDTTKFGTKFNRSVRDSGAIIVGAGSGKSGSYGTPLSKMGFSSYGSRVDVQAWGSWEVYSAGYGDLFYPNNDPKQSYTKNFAGTSSASPMITSIVAQIQGRNKAKNNGAVISPSVMRDLLKNTNNSHPQTGDTTTHIGPLPDLELIFKNYFGDNSVKSCTGVTCSGKGTCKLTDGFASCWCNTGYTDDGLTCSNETECSQTTEINCNDGLDNDCDSLTDSHDNDCSSTTNNDCLNNARLCDGNALLICGQNDNDSYTDWKILERCQQGCNQGSCLANCTNDCTNGQKKCSGNNILLCSNYDSDSCTEWGTESTCSNGQVCNNGSCETANTCTDKCSQEGSTRCYSNGVQNCQRNANGCLEYVTRVNCASDQICANSTCMDKYREDGTCASGVKICQDSKTVYECKADGSAFVFKSTCANNETCNSGFCYKNETPDDNNNSGSGNNGCSYTTNTSYAIGGLMLLTLITLIFKRKRN